MEKETINYGSLDPQSAPSVAGMDGWRMVPWKTSEELRDVIDLLCDDPSAFEDSEAFWQYLLSAAPVPPVRCQTCNDSRVVCTTPQPPAQVDERELDQYDAGLLNDFGGGNVEWWQDYIRAELGRAHEFYQSQCVAPSADGGKVESDCGAHHARRPPPGQSARG